MGQGLLDTLYNDCEGFIEFRVRKSVAGARMEAGNFFKIADADGIKRFIKTHRGYDVWFGVATRDGKKGKKENIVHIPAVWADMDWKTYPGEREGADHVLETFPLKPAIVVCSGGGYHCYWPLKEPYDQCDIEKIETVLRKLAGALRGDFAATDASRILRVPKTKNFKYVPERPVTLQYCNGAQFELTDFDFILDPPPQESKLGKKDHSENLGRIMACAFMVHCQENAKTLDEPSWYAMITQLMKEPGGQDLIHVLSKPYPKYKRNETDQKILKALNSTGPHSCQTIREKIGFECVFNCGVVAPAALAFRKPYIPDMPYTPDPTLHNLTQPDSYLTDNLTQPDTQGKRNLWGSIKMFVDSATGKFNTLQLDRELDLRTRREKQYRSECLSELVLKGTIEKSKTVNGEYRKRNRNVPEMDIMGADVGGIEVSLPLDMQSLFYINKKDIILVSGETNAGKTAFMFATMWMNIRNLQERELIREKASDSENGGIGIRYLSSETHPSRVHRRLKSFGPDYPMEEFSRYIPCHYMQSGFHDMVDPDGFNFIDYIEAHDGEFQKLGEPLTQIHHTLDAGIAFVGVQQKKGSRGPRGGDLCLEKPSIAISLTTNEKGQYHTAVLLKVKEYRERRDGGIGNCQNMELDFIVRGGVRLIPVSGWDWPKNHYARRKNADYSNWE